MRSALASPVTWLSLAGATAASGVLDSPVPILFGLGAFTMGLLAAWLRAPRAQEVLPSRPGVEALAASQQEQVRALEELKDRILAGYRRLPGGGVLVASSERRLDALVDAFVRLLSSLNAYRQYLNSADRRTVEVELHALEAELGGEGDARLREVKVKRRDILKQRLERFAEAASTRELVSHQLATIEDVLRLAFEQSIAIRDPEVVARQLDAVAAEVASTRETARELEQFLELDDALGPRSEAVRVR